MFTYETTVKLHQTDAAGVCFFGNYFFIAHDAYEAFMESIDFSLRYVIEEAEDVTLIVHSKADYRKPTYGGDPVTVELGLEKLGRTSFTLKYDMYDRERQLVAEVRTVHVAVNKASRRSARLPQKLVAGLRGIEAP